MNLSPTRNLLNRACLAALVIGFSASAAAQTSLESSPTLTAQGVAPTATGVYITHNDANSNGFADVGETLTVNHDFSDADGDTLIAPTIEWLSGATPVGTGTTYQIQSTDVGNPIKVTYIARTDANITDPAASSLYDSSIHHGGNGIGVITPGTNFSIAAVNITGMTGNRPLIGSLLTANAVCEDGAQATVACGQLSYQWYSQVNGTGAWTEIANATSQTYTPVSDALTGGDQKDAIKVKVSRVTR